MYSHPQRHLTPPFIDSQEKNQVFRFNVTGKADVVPFVSIFHSCIARKYLEVSFTFSQNYAITMNGSGRSNGSVWWCDFPHTLCCSFHLLTLTIAVWSVPSHTHCSIYCQTPYCFPRHLSIFFCITVVVACLTRYIFTECLFRFLIRRHAWNLYSFHEIQSLEVYQWSIVCLTNLRVFSKHPVLDTYLSTTRKYWSLGQSLGE